MDLDPMVSNTQEDYSYSDYDNRPIRPMNQEALNETLARLPILIDEDDYNNRTNGSSESNTSIKARLTNRRQPILAYSTRRKNLPVSSSGVNNNNNTNNQSLLHVNTTMGTPKSNKRKLGGFTPTVTPSAHKVIKQLDWRLELAQLKEENKILEEAKTNLQLECVLLKNTHETELDNLKQEHQQTIETLFQEHKLQREQFDKTLTEKEQSLIKTNLELDNLRNDHTLLLFEKETLDKIVGEYQLFKEEMTTKLTDNEITIKNLREEIEKLNNKIHEQQKQQKQSATKSALTNGRMQLKGTATDRPRTTGSAVPTNTKNEPTRSKGTVKASVTRGTKKDELMTTPSSSVNTSLNKSNSSISSSTLTLKPPPPKSKTKTSIIIEEKKKSVSSVPLIDKRASLIATRTRSKAIPTKS